MSILNQVIDQPGSQWRHRRLSIIRGVASFHNTGVTQATLVIGFWAATARATVALEGLRQARPRPVSARTSVGTSGAASRGAVSRPSSHVLSAADLISNDDQRQETL
jgi:hypothetical protein